MRNFVIAMIIFALGYVAGSHSKPTVIVNVETIETYQDSTHRDSVAVDSVVVYKMR